MVIKDKPKFFFDVNILAFKAFVLHVRAYTICFEKIDLSISLISFTQELL